MSGLGWELPDEVIEVARTGADGAQRDALGVVIFGNIGDRNGILVHIQPHLECARLAQG